jgi:uncharacterized membrane protein
MAFCAQCGAQVEGRFCAKCGAPAAVAAAPVGPPPGAGVQPVPMPQGSAMADNVASALCYALGLITGVVFLVLEPYNKNRNVRFHAFQSIFFTVAWIALRIVLGIVFAAIWSVGGFFMASSISMLVSLCGLVIWLYLLISTYQGKTVVLPVIGPLARQQA